ncbi:MAG: hypothetical protein U0946_00460 [Patescibacteria group bacterium]|nr:hypothetical protein [Patescibacteria group bacterium]
MSCFKKKHSGQSLVEVVVAVGMMALLLTAVLSLIALSVKNSRLAKDRTKAVGLAQEGVELMRAYRDLNWYGLYAATGDNWGLAKNWTVTDGLNTYCEDVDKIDEFFIRCVEVTADGSDKVEIQVVVSWQEGAQVHQTMQTTNLTKWER